MLEVKRDDDWAGARPGSGWRRTFNGFVSVFVCGAVAASIAFTVSAVAASYYNYPGAQAMGIMHAAADNYSGGGAHVTHRVHISVAAAETGVSRFFQRRVGWSYSKNESLTTDEVKTLPAAFDGFDFLITDSVDYHTTLFEVRVRLKI